MPRNGSGVYSKPAGTTAVSGTTIESAKYNSVVDDLVTDANTPRPIVAGGTGATSLAGLLTTLGGQPLDAGLTSISGLTTAANKMIYTTASDVYAVADLSAAGRALIDDADATAQRATLGVVIGTNVQAYDATLAALASYNTNGILVQTAADTFAGRTITSTDLSVTITNPGGVAGNIDLSVPAASSGGYTSLGTITTTTGTSQSLTSLDLTTYRSLRLVVNGVSTTSTGNLQCQSQNIFIGLSAGATVRGIVDIDLQFGNYTAMTADIGTTASVATSGIIVGNMSISTATTTLTMTIATGNFDAGSIRVWGLK